MRKEINMFDAESNKFRFAPNLIKSDVWKWKTVETIIVVFTCVKICSAIPFVPKIGNVFKLMSSLGFGMITIKGIGEMSVTQRLIYEFKYLKRRRKLHLRSPEYIRKEKTVNAFNREDKSPVEFVVDNISEKISLFIEKHTADEEQED